MKKYKPWGNYRYNTMMCWKELYKGSQQGWFLFLAQLLISYKYDTRCTFGLCFLNETEQDDH